MRSSLENIEFVETYLLGSINDDAHNEMKLTIAGSSELSELSEFQELLILASQRMALRAEIESYGSTNGGNFFGRFKIILFVALLLITTILTATLINSHNSTKNNGTESPSLDKLETTTTQYLGTNPTEKGNDRALMAYLTPNVTSFGEVERLSPWIPFKKQLFHLNAQNGGTLEGEDGALVVLAKNALLDKNGKTVIGKVTAELIEAIHWEDMIAYNLTTMNGDKALSSGGMLRIQFEQNGQKLSIDPNRPLHIEIPTENYDPSMMAWEGINKNGKLDWQNPIPLKKYLTEIPLELLDFLPKGFEAEVASFLPYKNHTSLSQVLVDSLYYAISMNSDTEKVSSSSNDYQNSCIFKVAKRPNINGQPNNQLSPYLKGKGIVTGQIVDEKGLPIPEMNIKLYQDDYLENQEIVSTDENGVFTYNRLYAGKVTLNASLSSSGFNTTQWKYCAVAEFEFPTRTKNFEIIKPIVATYSSQFNGFTALIAQRNTSGCFIDPLSIKTLKTSEFQHSFIATKEFEERLRVMHTSKNGSALLAVYLNNLTKELWQCDQLASELATGKEKEQFMAFSNQRLTTVENEDIYQDKIVAYYTEKRKEYRDEQQLLNKEYQAKTANEIAELRNKIIALQQDEAALAAVFAQQKGRLKTSSSRNDAYLNPASIVRKRNVATVNSYKVSWYSSAWINIDCYLKELGSAPWVATISADRNSNQMTVYQCIRELKTLVGLSRVDDRYTAKFPRGSDSLDTYCLAIDKSDGQLYYAYQDYIPSANQLLQLRLAPISEDNLYQAICAISPEASPLAQQMRETKARLTIELRIKEQQGTLEEELTALSDEISKENERYNRLFDVINNCPSQQTQKVSTSVGTLVRPNDSSNKLIP